MAEAAGVAYLFAPTQAEMFPDEPATVVSVVSLADVLEGAIRPGHFDGVATIVTKLLSLAGACRAYFGEKDYQQLAIVRRLTADLSLAAEIVGCPTVRASDGLALSSRNAYLTPEERAVAPTLYRALQLRRCGGDRHKRRRRASRPHVRHGRGPACAATPVRRGGRRRRPFAPHDP